MVCAELLSRWRSGRGVCRDVASESPRLSSSCQLCATSLPTRPSHGWPLLHRASGGRLRSGTACFCLICSLVLQQLVWALYGRWQAVEAQVPMRSGSEWADVTFAECFGQSKSPACLYSRGRSDATSSGSHCRVTLQGVCACGGGAGGTLC